MKRWTGKAWLIVSACAVGAALFAWNMPGSVFYYFGEPNAIDALLVRHGDDLDLPGPLLAFEVGNVDHLAAVRLRRCRVHLRRVAVLPKGDAVTVTKSSKPLAERRLITILIMVGVPLGLINAVVRCWPVSIAIFVALSAAAGYCWYRWNTHANGRCQSVSTATHTLQKARRPRRQTPRLD